MLCGVPAQLSGDANNANPPATPRPHPPRSALVPPPPAGEGWGGSALLSARGLSKSFGATRALDHVDFELNAGEIHALAGENGAGKSTLIGVLGGAQWPDEGAVHLAGRPCHFASPREALAAGIATIPQHLRLVSALSLAENIALGDLPARRLCGIPIVERGRMREEAGALLAELGYAGDPKRPVAALPYAERQLVAIARALRRRCRVLILDEPTAALAARETERLFAVLDRLRGAGTGIVYVSHRLAEIARIADRCSVLRDGKAVASFSRDTFDVGEIVHAMTGRADARTEEANGVPGAVLLDERDGVRIHAGGIAGLAGRLGSGVEARLRRLFGAGPEPAAVTIKARATTLANPRAAIAVGIGMVPGERGLGLVMNQSVRDNILLAGLAGWRLDRKAGDRRVGELMDLLDIRPRNPSAKASSLSGGNQQKVMFAKWLALRTRILLLDEPTQGIDVGAKAQIHRIIRDFARRGGGVGLRSSELDELILLCDSVLAVREGRIAARLDGANLDEPSLRRAIGE
jgi:ribose transport system ATP-binding protein